MKGTELIRLLMDSPDSTVKVKLATGRTYNVSGAEYDAILDEEIIWIRTEPVDG